jgi:hypothetical protein
MMELFNHGLNSGMEVESVVHKLQLLMALRPTMQRPKRYRKGDAPMQSTEAHPELPIPFGSHYGFKKEIHT